LITEAQSKFKKEVVSFNREEFLVLDDKDAGLLSILAENCRAKNVDIAKKLKISEDVVRLRIKSLERRNIITGYTISVNEDKLGYESYQMLLEIDNMTDIVINKINYYVYTNPFIVFCARTSGKNNIVMNIYAKNRTHFNKILLEIRNALPEISSYEFQLSMKTHKEVFVPEQKLKEINVLNNKRR
jgi:Lrp/AsnC family leucine-responsive transcriptional regulator